MVLGDLTVNSAELSGKGNQTVSVALVEPEVKEVYVAKPGGRAYKYEVTGVRKSLQAAFAKILGKSFKTVNFVTDPKADLRNTDYVLRPMLDIQAANDYWTDACLANLSVEVYSNHTSFRARESSQFKRSFMSDAGTACTIAVQEVVTKATGAALKKLPHSR